jgi:hypothetical protein
VWARGVGANSLSFFFGGCPFEEMISWPDGADCRGAVLGCCSARVVASEFFACLASMGCSFSNNGSLSGMAEADDLAACLADPREGSDVVCALVGPL